jgi:hypothetical protein
MVTADHRLGEIADRVLFENERVRIWEMKLDAGAEGPVHRHDLDHILIQIDGDRVAIVPQPDTRGPYKAYEEADVLAGRCFYVERGGIEAARNVGRRTYHELIIELKD